MLYATAGPNATPRPNSPTNTMPPPILRLASPPAMPQPLPAADRLARLSERPEGVAAVLTVAAFLADLPAFSAIDMGGYLDDLGRDPDATFGRPGGPSLSCSAATGLMPLSQALTLGLITDLLVSNAYVHGFRPGDGGRIAVCLVELDSIVELTIDDSGLRAGNGRTEGAILAGHLVRKLGGWLETPEVIGGKRYIITVPRDSIRQSS